jgi:hypothetical protein
VEELHLEQLYFNEVCSDPFQHELMQLLTQQYSAIVADTRQRSGLGFMLQARRVRDPMR